MPAASCRAIWSGPRKNVIGASIVTIVASALPIAKEKSNSRPPSGKLRYPRYRMVDLWAFRRSPRWGRLTPGGAAANPNIVRSRVKTRDVDFCTLPVRQRHPRKIHDPCHNLLRGKSLVLRRTLNGDRQSRLPGSIDPESFSRSLARRSK